VYNNLKLQFFIVDVNVFPNKRMAWKTVSATSSPILARAPRLGIPLNAIKNSLDKSQWIVLDSYPHLRA